MGKQTKINIQANKILKQLYLEKGIDYCEARLDKCMTYFGLSFHHLHKRFWYYNNPELLSEYNQTIIVCANCHSRLERDKKLSEETFKRLRGVEETN